MRLIFGFKAERDPRNEIEDDEQVACADVERLLCPERSADTEDGANIRSYALTNTHAPSSLTGQALKLTFGYISRVVHNY